MATIDSTSTEKALLRRLLRLKRRDFVCARGAAELHLHAIAMGQILIAKLAAPRVIAGYVSNGREVDPMPALEMACALGIITALPAIDRRGGTMRFLAWRPGDALVAGPYGTAQPNASAPEIAPDTILAPLLGFDRAGNRLGQGGGHYDRAFAAHPGARRIGLAWSVQEAQHLPVDPWDLPLHGAITESEWIDFS